MKIMQRMEQKTHRGYSTINEGKGFSVRKKKVWSFIGCYVRTELIASKFIFI